MEIIIGSVPPLKPQNQKPVQRSTPLIEAQLLHIRAPRQGIAGPSGRERRTSKAKDPRSGRILTIMVPDGAVLPADLDVEKYDVSIRLIRRE